MYQDRFADTDKSQKRFHKDKELLLEEVTKNPKDTRSLFYLAQTCAGLGQLGQAREWYTRRAALGGFLEEQWTAKLRVATLGLRLKLDWYTEVLPWLFKTLEQPAPTPRSEPAVILAEYYKTQKKWDLSYKFAKLACERDKPLKAILFYNHNVYDYDRWHLLGITAYYEGKMEVGRIACEKAIDAKNLTIDYQNLQFYLSETKKYLVVGHPRTGSGYMAAFLNSCGHKVGHEKMRSDGISCWMAAHSAKKGSPEDFDPYWTKYRRRPTDKFEKVVYHIRNPKDSLPSITGENKDTHSYNYRREVIKYHFNIDLNEYKTEDSAVISLYYWDKLIISQCWGFLAVIKVEEAEEHWDKFTDKLPEKFPSKNINTRSKKQYDFKNITQEVLKLLKEYCKKYDYRWENY